MWTKVRHAADRLATLDAADAADTWYVSPISRMSVCLSVPTVSPLHPLYPTVQLSVAGAHLVNFAVNPPLQLPLDDFSAAPFWHTIRHSTNRRQGEREANGIRMCLDGQVAGLGWASLYLFLLASVGSQVQLALLCKCPQPSTMLTPISCMRTSSIYKLCRNQHSSSPSPSLTPHSVLTTL